MTLDSAYQDSFDDAEICDERDLASRGRAETVGLYEDTDGPRRMKLSEVERLSLWLQFQILEHVDPESKGAWAQLARILERGYEFEYHRLNGWFYQSKSEESCIEVRDILMMYDRLQQSYKDLGRPKEISEDKLKFPGFDGNNEGSHLGYARFLREDLEEYRFVEVGGDELNSHWPMLYRYRAMLEAWKRLAERYESLSTGSILEILEAGEQARYGEGEI